MSTVGDGAGGAQPISKPQQRQNEQGFKKTQADTERSAVHNYSIRVCCNAFGNIFLYIIIYLIILLCNIHVPEMMLENNYA